MYDYDYIVMKLKKSILISINAFINENFGSNVDKEELVDILIDLLEKEGLK